MDGDDELMLVMNGITKRFPGIVANDGVTFELRGGEIHTLLGENGAGKSTLMNVLDGIYYPDEGEILIEGKRVDLRSPLDSMKHGIGMIHQHFMLVDSLTVIENVILGLESQGFRVNQRQVARQIEEIARKYNFRVDPYARIWQLSVGEQQRVEIIKMLFRGARILILDEPTAVLTPQESEELFTILREMKSEGKSIVFISHKLSEVMAVSDRITVLRKGRVIGTVDTAAMTEVQLARMMIGRDVLFRLERRPLEQGPEVLKVENARARNDRGLTALDGLSLTVHAGEILGIAGVAGNGQLELAECIAGLRRLSEGRVTVGGADVTNASPCTLMAAGVAYIPADRLGVGLVPNLSTVDNAILHKYRQTGMCRGGFVDYGAACTYADTLIERFDISVPLARAPVKVLSGGNMQKLLLAREIDQQPRLLIAEHPTRGLDVGATEFVHKTLLAQRDQGVAVLLISEDLDEILMVADRVAVMYEGRIMGIVDAHDADIEQIGLMMAGAASAQV
ncbi:MAG TPA: ABC transporter ATP-binding protein [Candidatus Cryosericum sp.]|nr:ABC transporter ATP-binding protein [Candidatus Cryosericum sp.]